MMDVKYKNLQTKIINVYKYIKHGYSFGSIFSTRVKITKMIKHKLPLQNIH